MSHDKGHQHSSGGSFQKPGQSDWQKGQQQKPQGGGHPSNPGQGMPNRNPNPSHGGKK